MCPFGNSNALSIVIQVFRCCTHEIVSFKTLFATLYSILWDSSDTSLCKPRILFRVRMSGLHREKTYKMEYDVAGNVQNGRMQLFLVVHHLLVNELQSKITAGWGSTQYYALNCVIQLVIDSLNVLTTKSLIQPKWSSILAQRWPKSRCGADDTGASEMNCSC